MQSIKNKLDEIDVLLSTEQIDILCVSESHIKPEEIDHVVLNGYKISSSYCRKSFLNGGVIILTKKSLITSEISNLVSLSQDKFFECSAIQFSVNSKQFYILCLYRSPDSDVHIFLSKFEECLNLIFNKNKCCNVIICGDFNIDLFDKSKNAIELLDLVKSYYLTTAFEETTRIHYNKTETAIDYMLTNFDSHIKVKTMLRNGLSDHFGQLIAFSGTIIENNMYTFRSFSKKNSSVCENFLRAENWQDVFNANSVDEKFQTFINILQYYYEISFKIVTKDIRDSNSNKGWITLGIKKSSIRLKELYNLQQVGIISKEYYNKYKSIYNKVLKHAKQMYFDNIILNSANKSSTVWKIINNTVATKTGHFNQDSMLINDKISSDKIEIANAFNSYFVNLPGSLLQNHNITSASRTNAYPLDLPYLNPTNDPNFKFIFNPVTESEIVDVINSLKNSNSVGPDLFSTKIIKKFAHLLAVPLCHLINECFSQECFPNILKLSKVIPLFKKGDVMQLSNYRPISLLSIFSKIFEKLLANRIVHFLESYNILSKNQHGFHRNRSTLSALASILNYIYKNLDQGNKVMAVFVDLSKAFDCVDHDILLKKIECYGLHGQCQKILKSYLNNRKQFVDFCNVKSRELSVDIGVPQGSVLGPLLFLLYINDIESIFSTFYSAFADDISIIVSAKNEHEAINKLNENLSAAANYFLNNKLVLNQDKTFSLQFHPIASNYLSSALIKLNGKSIHQVQQFKLLGIYIDLSLDWKFHVNSLCNKCASNCFALKRLCQISSTYVVKNFYYSNFESRLRYGVIFWGNSTMSDRVFILQKRAIRAMFGLKYRESCKPSFIKHKILTLPSLYILEILTFVKKNLSDFTFQNVSHEYSTRHGFDLQYNIHRLELYTANPYYIGAILYNKLDNTTKNILSVKKFISTIKNMLLKDAYYSVREFLLS